MLSILFCRNRSFALGATAIISLCLAVIPVAVLLIAGIFLFTKKKVKNTFSGFGGKENNTQTITQEQTHGKPGQNVGVSKLNAVEGSQNNTNTKPDGLSDNAKDNVKNNSLISLDDNNNQKINTTSRTTT